MTLQITDDVVYDEQITLDPLDNDDDVAAFSSGLQSALAGLTGLIFASNTGFPQFAQKDGADFISSDQQVTDYFLSSSGTGTAFSMTTGVATDLFVGSDQVFLFAYSATNDNVVLGRIGNGTTADSGGDVAVVIVLNETQSGGLVTDVELGVAVYAPLVHDGGNLVDDADVLDLAELIHLGSTFTTSTEVPFENFMGAAPGNNAFVVVAPTSGTGDVELLVTGYNGSTYSTVNVSTTGLGTGAQSTGEGEKLLVDVVSGLAQEDYNQAGETASASQITYTDHVGVISATFEIEQINPTNVAGKANTATVTVLAYDTANFFGVQFPTNATSNPGTAVTIDVEDVRILDASDQDITDDFYDRGGTVTASGVGVRIVGLLVHEQVKFSTDGVEFDRFFINNTDATAGNDSFDVGEIHVTTLVGGSDDEFAELGSRLIFEDDGPSIAAAGTADPTLSVSDVLLSAAGKDTEAFAGLFSGLDFGADGEGFLTYDVGTPGGGVNSGLIDTATDNPIFLYLELNTDTVFEGDHKVVGRVGTNATTPNPAGDIAFFIAADPDTGEVTLQQERAVFHDKDTNDTSVSFATANLVTLTATIHDSEDDPATTAVDESDTDSATVNIGLRFSILDDVPTITPQPEGSATPNDLVVDNSVGDSDSSAYTLDPGNDLPAAFTIVGPDTTGDFTFAYFDVNNDTVTGENEIKGFYQGDPLYTLILNANGSYTFTMIGVLPSAELPLDINDIKAGGPDTNFIDVGTLNSTNFVRISGDSTAGAGNINESNANVGVDNGNLDAGESLTFTLNEGTTQLNFQGISIGTKSAQASTYHWEATLTNDTTISADVTVPKNGTILIEPTLPAGVLIESIEVTKISGSATKIGLRDIDILVPPDDVVLDFDVQLADKDEDIAPASFTVSIDGNLDGVITDPIVASSLTQIA